MGVGRQAKPGHGWERGARHVIRRIIIMVASLVYWQGRPWAEEACGEKTTEGKHASRPKQQTGRQMDRPTSDDTPPAWHRLTALLRPRLASPRLSWLGSPGLWMPCTVADPEVCARAPVST